ncbi:hypothetical protein [Actinomadura macra]|uniref:hypothetical protein n=1 Tax=Actinomadura macra TaxID=46164 RepID=UPI000830DDAA|nr:hypothetical protein [Actinomadura macra]
MAPPSEKEIKFKGPALRKLGADIEKSADSVLKPARTQLDGIGVGYPGFSVVGIPLALAHTVIGNQASQQIEKASTQIKSWRVALDKTARTWENAESKSETQAN